MGGKRNKRLLRSGWVLLFVLSCGVSLVSGWEGSDYGWNNSDNDMDKSEYGWSFGDGVLSGVTTSLQLPVTSTSRQSESTTAFDY